jgi:hypothetical protein
MAHLGSSDQRVFSYYEIAPLHKQSQWISEHSLNVLVSPKEYLSSSEKAMATGSHSSF